MPLHQFLQEFKGSLAIAYLGHDAFQHLVFLIDSAQKVVRHPVNLHVDFVLPPMAMQVHCFDTLSPDLGGEHRAEPVPPVLHSLVADLDAALAQEVLNVAKRQREADVEHHRQTDDLRAGLEVAKRGVFGHQKGLQGRNGRLKPSSSDKTVRSVNLRSAEQRRLHTYLCA
jgi:hypothetical protein